MILGITQARLSSTRLKDKVLMPIASDGRSLLELHLDRILRSRTLDRLILAIGDDGGDLTRLKEIGESRKIGVHVGSVNDVLDRFYQASAPFQPETVVRLTSDCPLIDPLLIDQVVKEYQKGDFDYFSNTIDPTFPDGQDIEVMRWGSLQSAWRLSIDPSEREHVTPYIWRRPDRFKLGCFRSPKNKGHLRMTVDYEDDLQCVRRLVEICGDAATWQDYSEQLERFATRPQHIRNATLKFKGGPTE